MKKQLVTLLLHAVYFAIAVLFGIYLLATNKGAHDVLMFVLIYLVFVAIEAVVEVQMIQKRPTGQAALQAALALASSLVAFILFLFIAYSIGEATGNPIVDRLIAVVLFLAIEWPIRTGLNIIAVPARR